MNSLNINIATSDLKHDYNNSIMPVIKLKYNGDILYANMSSFDLLLSWNCLSSSKLPKHICTNIISANKTVMINYNNKRINFIVVPFPEADYIGIYAFEIISNELTN